MFIQFMGYRPEPNHRCYTFQVREDGNKSRTFTLIVNTQSLRDCKFKDQDIPDLCYAKMKKDLAAETEERPVPLSATISESELRSYTNEHYPSKKKSFKI